MKKLLLSCCLALGIGANAQYNYLGNFEESDVSIYGQFGGGTITAAAACSGSSGGQLATSSTYAETGWMLMLDELEIAQPTQTNNSQAATVSIKYKKASGPVGTLYLTLFQYDETSDSWSITPITTGVSLTNAAITTCSTITGTIPAGVLEAGKIYAVGGFYVRTSGSGNIYIDDISIVQDVVSTVPNCTTISAPANGSTVGSGMANIVWAAAPTATAYKLTVGTTAGGSDIYNATITGGVTSQYVSVGKNTTYYAKVVPTNANGDATGCTGISFSTDSSVSYCTPTSVTVDEKFSKVVVADINQTTTSTAAYIDNTAVIGNVVASLSYPITVTLGTGYTGDIVAVWIDSNQNGAFEDSERTILTYSNTTKLATGNITVPPGALLGNTRMRIRVDYQVNPVPCGAQTSGYGQAWDFTVKIAALTLPSCSTITAPANASTGISAPSTTLTWNTDTMATGYKVYVGTTSGGTDVVNGTVVTTNSLALSGLSRNTIYYAKVVPTNSLGDASGCSEISFTTSTNWTYCTATHATVNADRISNVAFADINNPSTVTTITGGYEDFTAIIGNVEAAGTYPIAITTASGNANDKVKVWIDSNQNGTFEDSEMTLLTYVSNTSTTGSITIPSGSVLGNTRMRIRLARQANASTIVACGAIAAQGRTQDYTLKIVPTGTLAASDINKGKNISIYPNPFTDVLRISDVKGVQSVSVNDISGREVKSLAPSTDLNLSNLKSGLYIVNLKMEDGSVKTFKAIKK